MKGNSHRKLYHPNYFGWHWFCDKSALRQKRYDKRQAKRAVRRHGKRFAEKDGEA